MWSSTGPRIQRVAKAPRKFGRRNYRQAFKYLDKEFASRCVYTDTHIAYSGGDTAVHIDHYNPKKKKLLHQDYFNLLLVVAHCNGKKGDFWPTKKQAQKGLRIINPCQEMDYSVHIAECPNTHRLWGKTATGMFHIVKLGLNAWHLVDQRAQRHAISTSLHDVPVKRIKNNKEVLRLIEVMKQQLERLPRLIPFEMPPPDYIFV